MYGLPLHTACKNVYADNTRGAELYIKTHYESLDIAGSNRIHYICFSLPTESLPEKDQELKELLKSASEVNRLI